MIDSPKSKNDQWASQHKGDLEKQELGDAGPRAKIAHDLEATLFVEAGAGSGKTTAIVNRVVNLVADGGFSVGQIAAITFTEAAARELRVRVRDALELRAESEQSRSCAEAAGQVESAAITTLHSFALRVLSDHPVEIGLPPGFGVLDEIASTLEFDESWRVFSGQLGDDMSKLELQERAAALDIKIGRFGPVAKRLDDNWDLLHRPKDDRKPLSTLDFDAIFDELDSLGELQSACISEEDTLVKGIKHLLEQAEVLRQESLIDQLQLLGKMKWPNRRSGRKDNWRRVDVDAARAQVEQKRDLLDVAIRRYRDEVISELRELVTDFVLDRVERRRRRGELSFHDLLVLARKLLRSDENVRQYLHQRYPRILLDEFQDTDPIQIELAVLIASRQPVGTTPWEQLAAELEPGRLVVVGDPKQSIYRFRRADIAVYSAAEDALVDESSYLTTNFRSVPGIVEWVNYVFGEAMGDGDLGKQPPYVPLAAFRPVGATATPITMVGQPHDKEVKAAQIRDLESRDVAAVVCQAMEQEWLIERDGEQKPARLRDIAVLVPSRLSLPALESAFAATNVPFRPETNSLVYATQEVRTLMAGVRAAVDPSNSVDVVGALRSALFAVGDDELLEWKLADGSWDYRRTDTPQMLEGSSIAGAFAVLRGWHADRWWSEPGAIVDRIVRERRLREGALAESRPRDRWRRYRFLAEQAREFTEQHGGDLQDFVAWVEVQSSDMARITEPLPAEPDDDAVRVLTVHGAKGLEFPIVILAGSSTKENRGRPAASVLFSEGEKPQISLGGDQKTSGYSLQASVEEVLDGHERVRLHYVAATRASDRLVVSAHHKDGELSIGKRTWGAAEPLSHLVERFEARGDEYYAAEPPRQLRLAGGSYEDDLARWQDGHESIVAASKASQFWSATRLAAADPPLLAGALGDDEPAAGAEEPLTAAIGQQVAGAKALHHGPALGSAVHAVLENVDFGSGSDEDRDGDSGDGSERRETRSLSDLAMAAAAAEGIPDASGEVEARVRLCLGTDLLRLARSSRHWRELYVAMPGAVGGFEGFIDLCIETSEGFIVADYKTDAVANASELADKVASYEVQAGAYAVALEHITSKPVVDCRFLFIGPDTVFERSVPDLDQVKQRVRSRLGIS